MIKKGKKRISITLNDFAYNQLISVANETNQTKSKIVNEIICRTLQCREIHKYYMEIKKAERIRIEINDKSKK